MNTRIRRLAPLSLLAAAVVGAAVAAAPRVAQAQDYIQQIQGVAGSDQFGHSIASDGAMLVVGDPQAQGGPPSCNIGAGAITTYTLSGGTWQNPQTINYGGPIEIGFGDWLSLRNNVLVVSAERETAVIGSTGIQGAGGFYVYSKATPTGPLNFVGHMNAPQPAANEWYTFAGLATNGTYIAAAHTPFASNGGKIDIYRLSGGSILYQTTVTSPLFPAIAINGLFITDSNALIVSTVLDQGGTGSPIAFQLNGTQATPINTTSTTEPFSDVTRYMVGDGNTVLIVKQRTPPPQSVAVNYLQVIKFGPTGVVASQDIDLPVTYNGELPSLGNAGGPSMTLKENKGLYVEYKNVEGQNGVVYNFVAGYKYLASTGEYYPAGIVRSDQLRYQNAGFFGGLSYDGTYLFIGDPFQEWIPGQACNVLGNMGAVDVMRPITTTPAGPSNTKQLASTLNQLDYQMGTVVATNGTYVLSGSQLDGDAVSSPGGLTLFENINNQWQQVDHYIDALTGGFNTLPHAYAFSADIDNNVLAVGEPLGLTGSGQVNTGSVFASTEIFPVGPFLNEIDPPAGVPGWSLFGWSVAVTGTTLVVGAPASANVGGTGLPTRGAAYVYTLGSGIWTQTQTLQPVVTGGTDHESFGTAVDASGNNVIVGIPNRTVAGKLGVGAVQIFTLVNGQYVSGGNFNAPTNLAANAQFGSTVSIGADYAVAGSKNTGTVVVYRRNLNSWAQGAVIAPGPAHFGAAVALEGTRFAAGSPSEDRVYRYERINGIWQRTGTISSPNPTLTFGSSLDIKNGTLVIGDPNATTGTGVLTTNSGAAYVVPITGF